MDLNWYVLQTKPKQENLVESYLTLANIEVFNPKIKEIRLIRAKKRAITVPLFPCYVFAKLKPTLFDMVIYTRGVRKILGINGRPKPIKESIIETIKERINGNNHIYVPEKCEHEFEICAGDYVVVVDGPLKGFVGVVERANSHKAVVLLMSMDYQVKAEIHKFLLRKVDPEILE
ncbi:transcription termination/antitermination protein NusG [Candidatus Chrysopegis kryptomonas]|uniref:Transcriptional antiterminator RfaH n=1 Tax=Candidatus Chryseopegocella kryptomonas TaxID=1633643 RepID=A0A0P1MWI7_9BACT|nr:transcription termination/antitermination NusG family protein [Candidatus Chrysopegis kryptomonas]CUT00324.1 transcriptional antiterminator RfaH [Candidatus Chrysopegis kryptomonas]